MNTPQHTGRPPPQPLAENVSGAEVEECWPSAALAALHIFSLGYAAPPAKSILVLLRTPNRSCLPSYDLFKID